MRFYKTKEAFVVLWMVWDRNGSVRSMYDGIVRLAIFHHSVSNILYKENWIPISRKLTQKDEDVGDLTKIANIKIAMIWFGAVKVVSMFTQDHFFVSKIDHTQTGKYEIKGEAKYIKLKTSHTSHAGYDIFEKHKYEDWPIFFTLSYHKETNFLMYIWSMRSHFYQADPNKRGEYILMAVSDPSKPETFIDIWGNDTIKQVNIRVLSVRRDSYNKLNACDRYPRGIAVLSEEKYDEFYHITYEKNSNLPKGGPYIVQKIKILFDEKKGTYYNPKLEQDKTSTKIGYQTFNNLANLEEILVDNEINRIGWLDLQPLRIFD